MVDSGMKQVRGVTDGRVDPSPHPGPGARANALLSGVRKGFLRASDAGITHSLSRRGERERMTHRRAPLPLEQRSTLRDRAALRALFASRDDRPSMGNRVF